MRSEKKWAARLAQRAARRRPDGSRGMVARRASRILAKACDDHNWAAMDALWQVWLEDLDEEGWAALTRWRGRSNRAEALFAAAWDPARDSEARAAIGAFCAEHGLVPGNDVARALYFVMTGQAAQHRALDPDASLLAAAYRGAGEATRAALRVALADCGDLDLVGVLARRVSGGRPVPMTADETGYLVGHLAGRADWAGLWRLVQDLPLADAVAAMRSFEDGWRPADDRGLALFAQLGHADPEKITAARDALMASAVTRVWEHAIGTLPYVRGPDIRWASLSPDGHQLALVTDTDYSAGCGTLDVFELPGGTAARRYEHDHNFSPKRVLHLGETIIASGINGRSVLRQYAGGRARETCQSWGLQIDMERCPHGFVTLLQEKMPSPHEYLRFATTACQVIQDVSLSDLGMPQYGSHPRLLAADAGSGRLALRSDRARISEKGTELWIVDGTSAQMLGHTSDRHGYAGACFAGPDRLITFSRWAADMRLWRLDGGRLELAASAKIQTGDEAVAMAESGTIAVIDRHTMTVKLLDMETLEKVAETPALRGLGGTHLWDSAAGRYLAAGDGFYADVVDTSPCVLAHRPLAAMTPADLARAADLLRDPEPGPAARPFLELLRDVLGYRFGLEVTLGTVAPPAADAADIGLSAADGQPC